MTTISKKATSAQPALLARVRAGNDRFNERWQKARAAAGDLARWTRITDEISSAWPKLNILCRQLMAEGYQGCLYPEGEHWCMDPEWLCYVCPKG